jgi:hypothetical protein
VLVRVDPRPNGLNLSRDLIGEGLPFTEPPTWGSLPLRAFIKLLLTMLGDVED